MHALGASNWTVALFPADQFTVRLTLALVTLGLFWVLVNAAPGDWRPARMCGRAA